MKSILSFFKKPIGIISLIVIIGGIAFFALRPDSALTLDVVIAQRGELVQEVSVTGRVKPAEQVDLSFEQSGQVGSINVAVSDIVVKGNLLLNTENSALRADLAQATASVDEAKARLAELKRGTRPEEIQAAETKVKNAEIALEDAKINIISVTEKAAADLTQTYADALTSIQSAVNTAKNSLLVMTDIQYTYFLTTNQESLNVADAKELAITGLFDILFAGRLNLEDLADLQSGIYGTVQNLQTSNQEGIDNALPKVSQALIKVKQALNAIPIKTAFTATERTNIATEKSATDTEIITVSAKQQAISVQKATNVSAIAKATADMNGATNALAIAEDDLRIKQAGATVEEIAAQEAQVNSAKATVQNIEAKLLKTELRAPIAGTVTKLDLRVGEFVSAGEIVVSVISESQFEVEANIPEVDITKVKMGNTTNITLDAYGSTVVFPASVVKIDPAETIIEGVPTYKVTLQSTEDDSRIRSGMTANIDILTEERDDVIRIPQRAVITKGGERIVRILNSVDEVIEVSVTVGVRGSDGNIEILNGINEGDRVILFIEE